MQMASDTDGGGGGSSAAESANITISRCHWFHTSFQCKAGAYDTKFSTTRGTARTLENYEITKTLKVNI
jgi:hypothetical protein